VFTLYVVKLSYSVHFHELFNITLLIFIKAEAKLVRNIKQRHSLLLKS